MTTTASLPLIETEVKVKANNNGRKKLIDLNDLLEILGPLEEHDVKPWRDTKLPVSLINVLVQARKTFEDIGNLADNIAEERLMNRLLVGKYTSETAIRQYLQILNYIWKTHYQLDDLVASVENGKNVWYVLIAGERRLRSHKLIWLEGCSDCREKYGKEEPGKCFQRHFHTKKMEVEVRIRENISPKEMQRLQLSENIHMALPPHEEAEGYQRYYSLLQVAYPDLSLARYARMIGRGQERITNALRFCGLFESLKDDIRSGKLLYGAGVSLAKLQEEGLNEEEVSWWRRRYDLEHWKVSDLQDHIAKFLRIRRSGQHSMFDVMTAEQVGITRRLQMRKVVAREIITAVWTWIHYFDIVLSYLKEDKLGQDESPFSIRSPVRMFKALAERQKQALPLLEKHLSAASYEECKETIEQFAKVLPVLEAAATTEGTAEEIGVLTLPSYTKA
ncbi:MAG: hypothetical protein PHE52_00435 [Candidatus Pacebacteria bacterium]|nr:hypothetical protein [Candidatus Paceibacterota bacterium]